MEVRNDKPLTTHHTRQPERAKRYRINDRLCRLAALYRVATSYIDEGGQRRLVSEHSLSRVLAVLGVRAETLEQVHQSLPEIRTGRWREMVDPVMVVKGNRLPRSFAVRLPGEADELCRIHLRCGLIQEGGRITRGRRSGSAVNIVRRTMVDGVCHHEIKMPFPKNLPLGYHSLSLEASGPRGTQQATMTVIVVPDGGYLPSARQGFASGLGHHASTLRTSEQKKLGYRRFP